MFARETPVPSPLNSELGLVDLSHKLTTRPAIVLDVAHEGPREDITLDASPIGAFAIEVDD